MRITLGASACVEFSTLDPGDAFWLKGCGPDAFIKTEVYAITGNVLDWMNKQINAIDLRTGVGIWVKDDEPVVWYPEAQMAT